MKTLKLDKRTLRKTLKEALECLLNGKISDVKYNTWEGSGTVTEWADLDAFVIDGVKIKTIQNDNFSVDFILNNKEYNIASVATRGII